MLHDANIEGHANPSYHNFEKACQEAAEQCIPTKPLQKRRKPQKNDVLTTKPEILRIQQRKRTTNFIVLLFTDFNKEFDSIVNALWKNEGDTRIICYN